jgi:hypothetical protein
MRLTWSGLLLRSTRWVLKDAVHGRSRRLPGGVRNTRGEGFHFEVFPSSFFSCV